MAATTTVTVTLTGVNHAHLPRLEKAVQRELTRFGSTITVEVEDPLPKPKKGK